MSKSDLPNINLPKDTFPNFILPTT
jgi:hypothetical protein